MNFSDVFLSAPFDSYIDDISRPRNIEVNYTGDGDSFNRTDLEYAVDESEVLFQFITNGVLLNIVGLLGIVGNIISMIILSRPQMKSSINYLLIGLARCDTVLIITSMLLFGLPAINSYTGMLFTYHFWVSTDYLFKLYSSIMEIYSCVGVSPSISNLSFKGFLLSNHT